MSGVSPAQQVSRRCVTLRAWKLRARGNGNRRGRAFRESLPCVKFRRSAHRPCTHAHGDAASDSATRTHIQEFDQTGSLDLSTLTNATVDILADAHTDTEVLGDTLASLFEGPAGANLGPWTFERVGGGGEGAGAGAGAGADNGGEVAGAAGETERVREIAVGGGGAVVQIVDGNFAAFGDGGCVCSPCVCTRRI